MTDPHDRWAAVKQILADVIDRPESARSEFLNQACDGDASLRRDVDSLLECHRLAGELDLLPALESQTESPRPMLGALIDALESSHGIHQDDTERTLVERSPNRIAAHQLEQSRSFGDYELLEELGRGGMGVVFKAWQRSLQRTVALKMISSRWFSRGEAERFQIEAQAAAKLDHPGIATVYEVGANNGRHYYSMAYIEGKSLSARLKERLTFEQTATYIRKIAEAMAYAHRKGVIHRDLKPSNVMLDESDQPKIVDFGLARELESDSNLTLDGQFLGTPSYAPPEQGMLSGQVGPAADIYSIGGILYTMLTGLLPFRGDDAADTIRLARETDPVAPRVIDRRIPKDLETICLRCLEKSPERRYSSAQDLADEMQRYLDGVPIQARPLGLFEKTWRWSQRNQALAALYGVIVLAVIVLVIVLAIDGYRLRIANEKENLSLLHSLRVIDEMTTRVSEEDLSDKPGWQPVRRDVLSKALAFYQQLLNERGDDPRLREEVAQARLRVANIQRELESPERALQELNLALALQEQLVREQPQNFRRKETLSDMQTFEGNLRLSTRDFDGAGKAYERAAENRQSLVDSDPKNRRWRRKLANARMNRGVLAKNRIFFGAVASGDTHVVDEGLQEHREAQKIRRKLLESDNTDLVVRGDLGKGHFETAELLRVAKTPPTSLAAEYRQAVEVFEQIHRDDPAHLDSIYLLGQCYQSLTKSHLNQLAEVDDDKTFESAVVCNGRALELLEQLVAANPDVVKYRGCLARVRNDWADLHLFFESAEIERQIREQLIRALQLIAPILDGNESDYLATYLNSLGLFAEIPRDLETERPHLLEAQRRLKTIRAESKDLPNTTSSQLEDILSFLDESL